MWREWEARLGVELVSSDGVLALGPAAERRLRVVEQAGGVAARRVGPAEIAERLPLLAPYAGPAVLDEDGGSIRTRAAVDALVGSVGDALVADDVLSVRSVVAARVEVRAGGTCAEYARVVVCGGAAPLGWRAAPGSPIPVRPAAHVRLTFAVSGDPPARLACLQDGSGEFGRTGVYGAPLPGNRHYALGLSDTVDDGPDGRRRRRPDRPGRAGRRCPPVRGTGPSGARPRGGRRASLLGDGAAVGR